MAGAKGAYVRAKMRTRTGLVVLFLLVCLLGALLLALLYGSYEMSLEDVAKTLSGSGSGSQNLAIWGIRIPRALVALFVGAALAASGGVLQGITQNPLAEPGVIGLNSGTTFFIVLYISTSSAQYYSALSLSSLLLVPLIAIVSAFGTATLIFLLSRKNGRIGKSRLILVGVGINIAFSAATTLFQMYMSKGDFNQALMWINGSLWGTGFEYLALIAPVTVVVLLLLLYKGRTLDVMNLGDEIAVGLGVAVERERRRYFALAVILAAVATAVAGNIAFVGLIGPHIAQRLTGAVHRRKLLVSALISAILVVVADVLSRNLFSPLEIPVGILLSLIGVPYFIYLMLRES
jgi:iron complex transport system permease protein